MLTVQNLYYDYGQRQVLRNISLNVRAGEVVSLVGANGAGKSTLLKCLSRFLTPRSGNLLLEGQPLETYSRARLARTIGYVPQQAGSAMSLPVADMIALGRAPHRGLSTPTRDRDAVMKAIERLDLQSLALRVFGELSGGERRRVLLARALAQETPLLLLDEPTSDLDLRHQLETMTLVRRLADEDGVAALVAIHDLSLAARFSDRLVLIRDGRVHANGPWREVLTTTNLEAAYGVNVATGSRDGLPYVIPIAGSLEPAGSWMAA